VRASTLNYPAANAGVVSVAATDDNDQRASFSNANSDGAVDDLGAAGRDTSYGFGRVNLCKAAGGGC
jgi:subtilisin family serine protease